MWERKFTVRGIFRTMQVIDQADLVAVWLSDKQMYQILKSNNLTKSDGHRTLASQEDYAQAIFDVSSPIILDESYMAKDEEGFVEW